MSMTTFWLISFLALVLGAFAVPASVSSNGELYTEDIAIRSTLTKLLEGSGSYIHTCVDVAKVDIFNGDVIFDLSRLAPLADKPDGTAVIEYRVSTLGLRSLPIPSSDIAAGNMTVLWKHLKYHDIFFRTCVGDKCCETRSVMYAPITSTLVVSSSGYSAFTQLSVGTHVTFETWMKPMGSFSEGIMGAGQNTAAYSRPFILAYDAANTLVLWIGSNSKPALLPPIDATKYHHYVVTIGPTESKVYLDGVEVISFIGLSLTDDIMSVFFPGYGNTSTTFYRNSSLDAQSGQKRMLFRIWKSQLTHAEVTELYNEQPQPHGAYRENISRIGDTLSHVSTTEST